MYNMKRIYLMLLMAVIYAGATAQMGSWKEFDSFHAMVKKLIHPATNGKLQPLKDSSAVLLAGARQWQASSVPKNVESAAFKADMPELVKQCTALHEAVVAGRSDKYLKALAVKVHDAFHELLSASNIKE